MKQPDLTGAVKPTTVTVAFKPEDLADMVEEMCWKVRPGNENHHIILVNGQLYVLQFRVRARGESVDVRVRLNGVETEKGARQLRDEFRERFLARQRLNLTQAA